MESRFAVGDVVRASVTAQGMTKGVCYTVVGVREFRALFGGFVTYDLNDGVRTVSVVNGHLLLTRAEG